MNDNEDAGFFVFPDLSVRTEGSYRLKLSLYEVVGFVFDALSCAIKLTGMLRNNVRHCKSIYSTPFYVYTAKKFPGMEGASLVPPCTSFVDVRFAPQFVLLP